MLTPEYWKWFYESRLGLFIHWGPYAAIGRGEQVLFRERLDQAQYERDACRWNPPGLAVEELARLARRAGMRYAVFTTRHHDGYCLWDSKLTNYTSVRQAPRQDFVRQYVDAFRAAGICVGLYYSLADWRIPAYWQGPAADAAGWETFRQYVHGQVRELLTDYGPIDLMWFDGAWPRTAGEWKSFDLVKMMRQLQPHILINNRLGKVEADVSAEAADGGMGAGETKTLGDFGTPEHRIVADADRLWESCNTTTWRLWGYTTGERWRSADVLLDMLTDAASKGGNFLLNVGPDADGRVPPPFARQMDEIGRWMDTCGECVYSSEAGEVCEFVTYGRQIRKGNNLYLVIRFWDRSGAVHLAGLETPVRRAVLLNTGETLAVEQREDDLTIRVPVAPPTDLFPVIRLECEAPPQARPWARQRLWCGDGSQAVSWAMRRGSSSVNAIE